MQSLHDEFSVCYENCRFRNGFEIHQFDNLLSSNILYPPLSVSEIAAFPRQDVDLYVSVDDASSDTPSNNSLCREKSTPYLDVKEEVRIFPGFSFFSKSANKILSTTLDICSVLRVQKFRISGTG